MQAGGVCAESAAPPASNASTDSENERAAERVRYMRHSSCGLYPQYPVRVYLIHLIPSLSDTTAAIDGLAGLVPIVVPDPCHGVGQATLIATLGHEVEEVVGADHDVEAPRVSRVGVKDGAGIVAVEHAGARPFVAREIRPLEVVYHFALRLLLRRKRDVIVAIEVVAIRRHPLEAPTHALLEGFDLGQRRA